MASKPLIRLSAYAGTMLFGEGICAAEAGALLCQAVDAGVNFFDSAEMYPVPQRAETQGRSEVILGQWLRSRRRHALMRDPLDSCSISPISNGLSWPHLAVRCTWQHCIAALSSCIASLVMTIQHHGYAGQKAIA